MSFFQDKSLCGEVPSAIKTIMYSFLDYAPSCLLVPYVLQYVAQVVNDFALTTLTYELFFQSQL